MAEPVMDLSDDEMMRLRARWRAPSAKVRLDAALEALRQGNDFGRCLTDVDGVIEVEGGRDLRGAPLSGYELDDMDLADTHLEYAELAGASLCRTRLTRADISGANLNGARVDEADMEFCTALFANLEGTSLIQAKLTRANLMGARLGAANLNGADLRWANLLGAQLDGANVQGANFENARLDSFAQGKVSTAVTKSEHAHIRGDARDSLDDAIEQLYRVFANYPRPQRTQASPWTNIGEDVLQQLYRAPLKQLTENDLATYARRALTVWGDSSEFRHYLPRILELVARGQRGWVDVDLFLAKLKLADLGRWPAEEQAALACYLRELFVSSLSEFPHWPQASEVLRGIGLAGEPLDWYLQTWNDDQSSSALCHLAQLILDEQVSLFSKSSLDPGLWPPESILPVYTFLTAPQHSERLENVFLASPEAPHAQMLASAADILHQL